jgi:prepilin-type N-terminal cleavage/methylation domain-containing protein
MKRNAFTLVELLVVIAIIALLLSVLLPATRLVRERGRAVVCRSNLRQMIASAHLYTGDNEDRYPMAYVQRTTSAGTVVYDCWDFIEASSDVTPASTLPGFLWRGDAAPKIQQCPSYDGSANWGKDPYTGYNYNASFVGGTATSVDGVIMQMTLVESVRASDIKCTSRTSVFGGDGEYSQGANKFMRSPLRGQLDKSFTARSAGSQGFRHLGSTNFAVADGSVQSTDEPVTEVGKQKCAKGTGFLSSDNSAYDVR